MAGPPLSEPVDQNAVAQLLQDLSRKMPPSELNSVLSQLPSSVQAFHPTASSSSTNLASAHASSAQRSASQSLEGALQGLQQLHGGLGLGIPPPASHPYQVNQHVPSLRSQAPSSTPSQYQLPSQPHAYPAPNNSAQYARPLNSFSYPNSSGQHHSYTHPPGSAPPGSYAPGYGQPRQSHPSYNQAVPGAPPFRPQHASPTQSYNPIHANPAQYNPHSDRTVPPSSKQSPTMNQQRLVAKRPAPVPQPTVPVRRGPGRPPGPSRPKDPSNPSPAAAKSVHSSHTGTAKQMNTAASTPQPAQFIPKPIVQYIPPAHVLPPPYVPPSQTNPFRLYQPPAPPPLPLIGPAAAAMNDSAALSLTTEDEVMTTPSFTSSGEPGVPSPAYPLYAPAATNRQRNVQATFTSYPSRLRTGVSVLMQPILNQAGTATPGTTSPFPGLDRGGRRRGPVNYAELNDGKSDEEEEADGVDGGPGRPKRLKRGDSGTNLAGKPAKKEIEREEPKTYLGMRPPTDKISLRTAIKTKHVYHDDEKLDEAAKAKEVLIPIRVDVDTDTHRIRDCFTWNLKESLLTPEQFARIFCQDIDLPVVPHAESIATQIRAQLDEFSDIAEVDVTYDESIHLIDDSRPEHSEPKRPRSEEQQKPGLTKTEENSESTAEMDVEEPDVDSETQEVNSVTVESDGLEASKEERDPEGEDEKKEELGTEEEEEVKEDDEDEEDEIDESQAESDCRIIVNLDVQISTLTLRDRIEWDLSSTLTPEHFAQTLVSDLGLPHESIPLISHAIHEELLRHKKDCLEWGFIGPGWSLHAKDRERARGGLGGGTILGGFGPNGGPKGLKGAWRGWDEAEEFQPILSEVSLEEIERKEFERERAIRRMRRETAKFTQDLSRVRRRR